MKNKTLILDYSKWRCGYDGGNRLGEGPTAMENDQGFSCCLGQFYPQINPETLSHLKGVSEPFEVIESILDSKGYDPSCFQDIPKDILKNDILTAELYNTSLSISAMDINDDGSTTPEEKIQLLQELFGKEGYTIEVINKPE